jgi:4-diphosphocytidyl-2-C-methyl-D-erythritol kinase
MQNAPYHETAPAKINLTLQVHGRRADGYHHLESLVAFTDLADILTLTPDAQNEPPHPQKAEMSLSVDGPQAAMLADMDAAQNLVLHAAHRLAEAAKCHAIGNLRLTKNLPVMAGLGGGSSDAAAALRLFNRVWGLDRDMQELMPLAVATGSDVAACLLNRPCLMTGRGEHVTPLDKVLPEAFLVLVNPMVRLATAQVFAALDAPDIAPDIENNFQNNFQNDLMSATLPDIQDFPALVAYITARGNDLTPAACSLAPVIGDVLAEIAKTGAAVSAMSGSGSTCFGLFDKRSSAEQAAAELTARQDFTGMWIKVAALKS